MTPAEFKTLREGMGLAAEEVATLLGVTRKTVFAMESPTRALDVPMEHAAGMRALWARFRSAVSAAKAVNARTLPRFTNERQFQEFYGVEALRPERGDHPAHSAPLPLSAQGPIIFAAMSARPATTRAHYEQ